MMAGKILSIIVPTYNMQNYLNRCLDSLILSPELMAELEVIVVNDGSTDNSSTIAHEYESRFPKSFVVIDKENGNYGSCVNRGLSEARGEYIKVLDADDWFNSEAFSLYLGLLEDIRVDLILTPFCIHYEKKKDILCIRQELPENERFVFQSYPKEKINRYSMHMITYRTEMLRQNHYRQTEGISYTDTEWTHLPQYYIKDFVYLSLPVYQYMVGREGQTMSPEVLARNIWKYEIISKSLITNRIRFRDLSSCQLADELNVQQIHFLASNIYRVNLIYRHITQEEVLHLKEFDDYLEKNCKEVYLSTDELRVKKMFPIRYVRIWRRYGFCFPFSFIRSIYKRIRYGIS